MGVMVFSRAMWGMSALVWVIVAVLWCVQWGWPAILIVIVFGVLPDVALIGAFAEKGRLKPSRVTFYNVMHTVAFAAGLIVIGVVVMLLTGGILDGVWQIALAGLAWFIHIAVDRVFGFGLRDEHGEIIPVQ